MIILKFTSLFLGRSAYFSWEAMWISTYESLSAGSFSPQCCSPLFLDADILESFLDDTSWSCEGEFSDELSQMQVTDWVLLSWNATQWTIDEDLKSIRILRLVSLTSSLLISRFWLKVNSQILKIYNSFFSSHMYKTALTMLVHHD